MTRREWLEKFIELADSGAPTVEYRRHCRVKAQHLPRHVRKLDQYRAELAKLVEDETPGVPKKIHYAIHSVAFKESDEVPEGATPVTPEFEQTDAVILLGSTQSLDLGPGVDDDEDIERTGEELEGDSELFDWDSAGEYGAD
jgi:hypothetical protein